MKATNNIKAMGQIANRFLEQEEKEPVLPFYTAAELAQKVPLALEESGLSEQAFYALIEDVALLTTKSSSKRFYNQLFGGRSVAAMGAEMLSAVFNTTMHTYKVAGVHVLIEQEVIEQMLRLTGFENGEGTFNPGGSMSNFSSMLVARNEAEENLRAQGFSGQKLIAYTSVEGHYSVKKNAGILGTGRENVRLIPSDDLGKMIPEKLNAVIQKDKETGFLPFYINATAGTTVLGVFDPFEALANIAEKHQVWLHVDGCLGGSALMSPKHKHLLKGLERADSFVWNIHKMMNVPLSASAILFRKKGLLFKHLSEKADYLFQKDEIQLDPGNHSLQCGRRNDAFKVWAAWKYEGAAGLRTRVERLFELAQYAADYIKKDPRLILFQEPESVNICFQLKGADNAKVCDELHKKGLAMVGSAKARGTEFIRLVCINPDIETSDLDHFFESVKGFLS